MRPNNSLEPMAAAVLKITTIPPGEAPAWVRECWVGLSLPLVQQCTHAHTHHTFGVLSRPKTRAGQLFARFLGGSRRETGYIVDPLAAISILAQSSPEAADWWRSNAAFLLQPGQYLLFHEGVGHVVAADAP